MREKIYEVYAENDEITFIMKDTYKNDNIISVELVGFYFGEPDEAMTEKFINKIKAIF